MALSATLQPKRRCRMVGAQAPSAWTMTMAAAAVTT
jgi:hypothetical protein